MAALRASPQLTPGCIVEVGVYWGGSAYNLIDAAKLQDRQIWLYDTFEGMMDSDPDKGDAIPLGDIKADEAKVRESLGLYPHIVKCAFPLHRSDAASARRVCAHRLRSVPFNHGNMPSPRSLDGKRRGDLVQ